MTTTKPKFLNRFTTIPFLLDLLLRKQLTLLNPNFWEDYNDRVTMELYRKKKNKLSIYALCLTDNRETVHHWNAFANGTSGCCIEFDYNKLLASIKETDNVNFGKTEYVKLTDLKTAGSDIEKLPYLKREAFYPENEFRIIALRDEPQIAALDVPISLDTIRRITISNKLPKTVFESVQTSIERICPEFNGRISLSTLFNNIKWTSHFEKQNGS